MNRHPAPDAASSPQGAAQAVDAPLGRVADEPVTRPITTPGAAYLAIDGTGIVKITDGKLSLIKSAATGPTHDVRAMSALPNGDIVALDAFRLWRIRDAIAEQLIKHDLGYAHVAVNRKGEIWMAGLRGIARWFDNSWSVVTDAPTMLRHFTLAGDNVLWAASGDEVYNTASGNWRPATPPLGNERPHYGLGSGKDGTVYVAATFSMFKFANQTWTRHAYENNQQALYQNFSSGVDGTVAASSVDGTIMIFSPKRAMRVVSLHQFKVHAEIATVRAIDGAGRIWIAADHDLVILNNDGTLAMYYPAGTLPGYVGAITAIVVIDGGPTLPKARPIPVGHVSGQVYLQDKPAANAAIELCPTVKVPNERRKTPCSDSAFVRKGTTNASGVFKLERVPAGSYDFAIRLAAKWQLFFVTNCCTAIQANQTFAAGTLTVKAESELTY